MSINDQDARCQRCAKRRAACTCSNGPLTPRQAVVEPGDQARLMTPGEVAVLFRVDSKTVTRWANQGRIPSLRTPGGHRRYREDDVRAALGGRRP